MGQFLREFYFGKCSNPSLPTLDTNTALPKSLAQKHRTLGVEMEVFLFTLFFFTASKVLVLFANLLFCVSKVGLSDEQTQGHVKKDDCH